MAGRKKQPSWKERLNQFGEIEFEANIKICNLLKTMSDEELKQIILDAEQVSSTNCWWAIYDVSASVIKEAKYILQNRELQKGSPAEDVTT